jgi:hypothetical protein
MENLTNSAEEVLIDSLSFKLPSSGQYVQDRRSCTFHTEGSNSYSAVAGTKVIRFRLAGDGSWLDPSTFRIMFDVVNTDTSNNKKLRPLGKAHGFFRRLRISVRGQIIEDIDNYNRVSELFHILQTPASRYNDSIEEFGYNYDMTQLYDVARHPGIGTDSQTVMFQPLCGLFQQTKYLPLRYAPLEIELELADVLDPIVSDFYPESDATNPSLFKASNTSTSWKIENCMVKVDLCTLDNALENSYVSHFMDGKTINIVYNTFISTLQTVVAAETQINVSRSLSKMKSVFVSLDKSFADGTVRKTFYNKFWNNFWSPNAGTGITEVVTHLGERFSHFQLQIGSKLFPEYPIKTHCEAFYSLRKALGVQANNLHSIDIDGNAYRNNKFIVGIDTEKLLGLSFTGMNTRNNLMTVHLKTQTGAFQADRMHIILLAEQILELADAGSMVYD